MKVRPEFAVHILNEEGRQQGAQEREKEAD